MDVFSSVCVLARKKTQTLYVFPVAVLYVLKYLCTEISLNKKNVKHQKQCRMLSDLKKVKG